MVNFGRPLALVVAFLSLSFGGGGGAKGKLLRDKRHVKTGTQKGGACAIKKTF